MTPSSEEEGAAKVSEGSSGESLWSSEAALLVRPFKTYRALGARRAERSLRDVGRGLLLEGVFLGAMVSLTSAGRMVLAHVAFTAIFWGFLPLLQIAAVVASVRVAAPRERLVPAVSLYFEGLGPYYVFFLVLPALCLFSPNVYETMTALLRFGVLPLYLLATIVWGIVVTWAFFRAGLGLSRARAGLAAAVFYVIFVGVLLGWYIGTNQIPPQVMGT